MFQVPFFSNPIAIIRTLVVHQQRCRTDWAFAGCFCLHDLYPGVYHRTNRTQRQPAQTSDILWDSPRLGVAEPRTCPTLNTHFLFSNVLIALTFLLVFQVNYDVDNVTEYGLVHPEKQSRCTGTQTPSFICVELCMEFINGRPIELREIEIPGNNSYEYECGALSSRIDT